MSFPDRLDPEEFSSPRKWAEEFPDMSAEELAEWKHLRWRGVLPERVHSHDVATRSTNGRPGFPSRDSGIQEASTHGGRVNRGRH